MEGQGAYSSRFDTADLPDEEEDVCRVCRVEGDEEMPLIYPCKCSGSVRYVHSDCLKHWLAASQKKHCEICGHRYTFTKELPDQIPTLAYFRQAGRYAARVAFKLFRFWLASNAWLIFLPAMNMFSLRSILWLADTCSPRELRLFDNMWKDISTQASGASANETLSNMTATTNNTIGNATATLANVTTSSLSNMTSMTVDDLVSRPLASFVILLKRSWLRWYEGEQNTLFGFIFRGQALSLALAGVIVGLILMREWMAQHNWAEHLPQPPKEHEPINPDDWYFINGMAIPIKRGALAGLLPAPATPPAPIRGIDPLAMTRESSQDKDDASENEEEEGDEDGSSTGAMAGSADGHEQDTVMPSVYQEDVPSIVKAQQSDTSLDYQSWGEGVSVLKGEDLDEMRLARLRRFKAAPPTSEAGPSHSQLQSPGLDRQQGVLDQLDETHQPTAGSSRQHDLPASLDRVPDIAYVAPELVRDRKGKGKERSLSEQSLSDDGSDETALSASASAPAPEEDEVDRTIAELRGTPVWRPYERKSKAVIEILFRRSSDDTPEQIAEYIREWAIARTAERGGQLLENNSESREDTQPDVTASHLKETVEEVANRIPNPASDDHTIRTTESHDKARDAVEEEWVDEESDNEEATAFSPPTVSPTLSDTVVHVGPVGSGTMLAPDPLALRNDGVHDMQAIINALNEARAERPVDRRRVGRRDAHRHGHRGGRDQQEQVEPRPIQAGDVIELEMEEDLAFDVEEWDGVLEVIGLIGPLGNLFQNLAFGIVIMGAAQVMLIGIPIWMGRVFISFDIPHSIAYTIELVLRGLKLIIEPVKDIVWEIATEVVYLPLLSSAKAFEKIITSSFGFEPISSVLDSSRDGVEQGMRNQTIVSALSRSGDFFATIGNRVYTTFRSYIAAKQVAPLETTVKARLLDMCAGYLMAGTILVICSIAAEAGVIFVTVKDAIKQQVLFLKLAMFMLVELAVFPSVLGIMTRIFTLPLFGETDVLAAAARWRASPASSLFLAWFLGTVFANLLSQIRKVCRPGTLFFIRDPTDPSYNPVNDIMHRSTASQTRKLGVSVMMYTFVLCCLTGVTCWGLTLPPFKYFGVLPLRLKSPPLSSVPFDLLFLHAVVPPSLESLRAKQRGKKFLNSWWKAVSRSFKLTDLLNGKRPSSTLRPESKLVLTLWAILDIPFQFVFGNYNTESTLARVPAHDRTALLSPAERKGSGNGVFIPLDDKGRPRTQEGKIKWLKQDRAAREAKRDPWKDYRVVWLPVYWRTRVHSLIFGAVGSCAAALAVVALVPLVVGRLFTAWFMGLWGGEVGAEVHDGYSLLAGFYLCWLASAFGRTVRKHLISNSRAARLRQSTSGVRFKRRLILLVAKVFKLAVTGLVLPTIVGLGWELYVGLPGRYGLRMGQGAVVIHFWDTWSMGAVITSLVAGMADSLLRSEEQRDTPATTIERIHDCICRPLNVPISLYYKLMSQVLLVVAIPVVLPGLAGLGWNVICGILGWRLMLTPVMFRMMYPASLLLIFPILARRAAIQKWSSVRQGVIDAEYVVEERVENYGQEEEGLADKTNTEVKPNKGAGEREQRIAGAGAGAELGAGVGEEVEVEVDETPTTGSEVENTSGDGEADEAGEVWEDVREDFSSKGSRRGQVPGSVGTDGGTEAEADQVAEVFRSGMYS